MLIQAYHAKWATDFHALKKALQDALGTLLVSIEHVGSTAVPGLAAKPILDVDIFFDERVPFVEIKSRLERIGYHHQGDQGIPGREVFKKGPSGVGNEVLNSTAHHLYVCPVGGEEGRRHLLFRDYLLANEEARNQYQRLKYQLAEEANQDRKTYAQLKEVKARAFIDDIVGRTERLPFVRA